MKKVIRNLLFVLAAGMLLAVGNVATGMAKKAYHIEDIQIGKTKSIYTVKKKLPKKKGTTTLKNITAKTNNKSVASVKITKTGKGKKESTVSKLQERE